MPNPNKRVFYACEAVAIGKVDPVTGAASDLEFVHGVQSVGMNTNFNVEAIFELGQSAPYDQVETNPEIEFTIEKLIDGYPFIYHMATSGATTNSLEGRLKERCNVAMAIGSDENLAISGGPGSPTVEIYMSGMYVNGLTYTFSADGNATESVTLVGNNKTWNATTPFTNATAGYSAGTMTGWTSTVVNQIDDRISPRTFNQDYAIGSGGIIRREDVIMESSIMPVSIFGVNGTGVGNNWNGTAPRAHITNITISMGDAGREDIYELGSKEPYYKTAAGSKEITTEVEVATVSGDFLGIITSKDTSPPQPIKLVLRNGATFDIGAQNKVTAVSYGGGEAGGGNLTITYSFTTQNDLTITPPNLFNILS